MMDRKDMINEIEMLLGSEGTHGMAQKIFTHLREDGRITFNGDAGFIMQEMDDAQWLRMLDEVLGSDE